MRSPSTSFVTSTDLPFGLRHSCMAAINSTHAILSGGEDVGGAADNHENVLIYNKEEDTWLEIESMQTNR